MKVNDTRSVNVCVVPPGAVWRRHIEQLHPRYHSEDDTEPGQAPEQLRTTTPPIVDNSTNANSAVVLQSHTYRNPRAPTQTDDNYGPSNPKRSKRSQHKITFSG